MLHKIDKPQLIGYAIVIHLKVVVIREILLKKLEVNYLFEMVAPDLFGALDPRELRYAVGDHVEGFLIVA